MLWLSTSVFYACLDVCEVLDLFIYFIYSSACVRTANNGLLQKRLEEDLQWIVPYVPVMTQSVKGLNWTGLQLDISLKIGYVMKMAWMSQWVVSLLDLGMEGCGFEFWFWKKTKKQKPSKASGEWVKCLNFQFRWKARSCRRVLVKDPMVAEICCHGKIL